MRPCLGTDRGSFRGQAIVASVDEVLAEIRRLAKIELQLDRTPQPDDRLIEDLGLDSMTLTALAVGLEDHFRVILTEAPPEQLATVGGLAAYVAAYANPESGRPQ
jgi:acyl carrier protein